MNNDLLYVSPYIIFQETNIKNSATGNVFECNSETLELLKMLREHEPLATSKVCDSFGLSFDAVTYLIENGILVHDKNDPNAEISVENTLVTEYDTFFGLGRGNLTSDLAKNERMIGIIGIDAPTSSSIYNIGKKSYNVLRDKSNDLIDLSMYSISVKDYGVLLNPLMQDISFKWLSELGNLLLESNIVPIFIGGDHGVTYHLLDKYLDDTTSIAILQIDAHRDIGFRRSKYPEHGSFIRDIVNVKRNINVYQYGIRDTDSEYNLDNIDRINIIKNLSDIEEDKIYISIDVDAFSYADIPAVSYPLPNGLDMKKFLEDITKISNRRIVGCDIVEYNSQFDVGNMVGAIAVDYILLGILRWLQN